MDFIELIKVLLIGIIEGITEWLPISSTGHMILFDELVKIDVTPEFRNFFIVVIQLGAIMAVVVLFWKKLWPFSSKRENKFIKKDIWALWFRIFVACLPMLAAGLLFKDKIDAALDNYVVVAIALIVYGVAFIVIEKSNVVNNTRVTGISQISYKMALFIGLFQVLSLIPGTSRSGVTIIGAMLLGASRMVAAEFTFYLAVPAMVGASLFELLDYGFNFSGSEIAVLILGMLMAFVVSIIVIRFLMSYIKKHNFVVFGWYRIALGAIVLAYFILR